MRFPPPFLLVSMLSLLCFGVCGAADCKLNDADPYKVAYTITVDQTGNGNFTTVQQAIDAIPPNNDRWIRIHVLSGVYREKVTIPTEKPCVFLEGDTRNQPIITYDACSELEDSATFSSFPDNVVAKGIAFKNSYNRRHPIDPFSHTRTQAVAARIYGDKSAFHGCGFLGLQDTLWDVEGRHLFNSCYIEGAVDFIFGNGQSMYELCAINVTAGGLLANGIAGYITAQGRNSSDDRSGFVFKRSLIQGTGQAYLGRAYGAFSRVIISNSIMSKVVVPKGWDPWTYKYHEDNITYAESNNNGPGSNKSDRVPWMKEFSAKQLSEFTSTSFIDQDGWLQRQPGNL